MIGFMNKRAVTFFAFAGTAAGGYLPIMLGWDPTGLNGPSILGGLIGGILGIAAAVKLSKSLNL